jgi:hypothetical protein
MACLQSSGCNQARPHSHLEWRLGSRAVCSPELETSTLGSEDADSFFFVVNFTKTVDDQDKFMKRPLLYHQPANADNKTPDRVLLQYGRRYYVGFGELPRSSHLPPITEAQAEALDALHFLGERYSVSTNFEKGDMQYVNNVAVFHARDGFTDKGDKQ